jgi:hypothetical protein
MSEMSLREYNQIINRQRRLPGDLARARRRVRDLEAEAQRLGVTEILTDPNVVNSAWERKVELAEIQGKVRPRS